MAIPLHRDAVSRPVLCQGSKQFAHVQRDQGAVLVFLFLNCIALQHDGSRDGGDSQEGFTWFYYPTRQAKKMSKCIEMLDFVDHVVSEQVEPRKRFSGFKAGHDGDHQDARATEGKSPLQRSKLLSLGAAKSGGSGTPLKCFLLREYRFRFIDR